MNDNAIPTDRFTQANEIVRRLREEIGRAVVGQRAVVDQVLAAFLAGGHVLLEGVPGLGKTLLVKALAKTFAGQFARIQFTPDLMPADVVGHAVFDLKNQSFSVRRGPVFTNLLLADEINRAPAKTQSSLLEIMQERQVTIEGESHALTAPFMVLATQNPLEQEGTYPLPEAQLDRFLVKVMIDYPSADEELAMLKQTTLERIGDSLDVGAVNTLIRPETAVALQQLVARHAALRRQRVDLVGAERVGEIAGRDLLVGAVADPGIGRIAIRALALLAERTYVTPDDIKTAGLPVLRHRVTLSAESELEGLSVDELLQGMFEQTAAPRA